MASMDAARMIERICTKGILTMMVIKNSAFGDGLLSSGVSFEGWHIYLARPTECLQDHAKYHPQSPKRIYDRTSQRNLPKWHLEWRVNGGFFTLKRPNLQTLAVIETSREYSCQMRLPIGQRLRLSDKIEIYQEN